MSEISDVVLVALITAVGTLAAGIVSQLLSARAASKQVTQQQEREEASWRRTEAKEKEDRQAALVQEFWGYILQSQTRMLNQRDEGRRWPQTPAEELPSTVAAQAYAVALLGIPSVRTLAKGYYRATAECETLAASSDIEQIGRALNAWRAYFDALEKAIIELMDRD
ncbi:hypothetical protein [Pigmentiphaga kullae]|uniref:Uncharacterized protein n=1 Tax=Pigmentiphaga kullae TaxID=151784 RepID=A0A4Q7NLV3_9BURK|nr:hypothetical protein [Pigmentiphaga kullae]RZS86053.1 hypothetical protein EV675_2087 [Pigmentiphaga kullae]